MVIIEKGYVKYEFGKAKRIEKRTEIQQFPTKPKKNTETAEELLEELKNCKFKTGRRRLWAKIQRMKKKEEMLFGKDRTKELVKDLKKYNPYKKRGRKKDG